MRSAVLLVISIGVLAVGGQARADEPKVRGQGWGGYHGGPGQGHWGHQPGSGGPSWVGVPGLDRGYDRWRWNADRAYRRGDFSIRGFTPRPYHPYGYGRGSGPYPYGYGWGSSW